MDDINELRLRALNDDAEAQYELANKYFIGDGVAQDYKKLFNIMKWRHI